MQTCLNGPGIEISGSVSNNLDVDVFLFKGPFSEGDLFDVSFEAIGCTTCVVSIFYLGDGGETLIVNDHRNAFLGIINPDTPIFLREGYQRLYVAVAHTPRFFDIGSYVLKVQKVPSQEPAPRPGIIVLEFNGGQNVRIGGGPLISFSSLEESPYLNEYYLGQIEGIEQGIKEKIIRNTPRYLYTWSIQASLHIQILSNIKIIIILNLRNLTLRTHSTSTN